jgi:hypothetical protein
MANGANPQAVSYAADMSPGNWESVQDIYAQYPNADLDLIQHYVRAGQISDDRGQAAARFGSLAHELNPIGWGVGGISSDDLIAGEGGIQGLNPQQAYDAGLLTHSEGKDWVGLGQGSIGEALQKAQDAGMFIPGYLNVAAGVPNVIESIKGVGQKAIDLPGEVWGNIKEYTKNTFPKLAVEAMSAVTTPASLGKWTGTSPVMRIDPFNEGKGGSYYQAPVPYLDYPGVTADERLEEHETALDWQKVIEAERQGLNFGGPVQDALRGTVSKIALDIPPTDFSASETPVLPREFPVEGWTPGIGDYDQPMGVPPWSFGVPSDLGGLPIVPLTESELESFQREIQMEGAARTSGDYSKAARDTGVYIDRPRDATKTTDVMPVVPGFDEKGNPITYPQEDSGLTLASYNPALAEELTYATVDPRQVGLDVFDPGRVTAAQENIAGRLERGEDVAEITQAITNPALLTENIRRGAWGSLRDFLMSPAQAKNTSIFKSPRIAVEPTEDTTFSDLLKAARTETGDAAINRLMQLDEPRIPFSLPEGARTIDPVDSRKYLLNRQFGTGTETRAPMVDTFAPPEPETIIPISREEADAGEEVSEKRVKKIKKKPKEKRTSIEEQVVVASSVKKALSNAAKGKKVKKELKAIVALAKVDPTIVKRYTTPGSQALQDITAQVDSFAFMPTIQKKKKAVPGYGLAPRRPGGR